MRRRTTDRPTQFVSSAIMCYKFNYHSKLSIERNHTELNVYLENGGENGDEADGNSTDCHSSYKLRTADIQPPYSAGRGGRHTHTLPL